MLPAQCLVWLLHRVPEDPRCLFQPAGKDPVQASKPWIVSFGPIFPLMHPDSTVLPSDASGSPHSLRMLFFNKVLIFVVVLETFHPLPSPLPPPSKRPRKWYEVLLGLVFHWLNSQPALGRWRGVFCRVISLNP